MEGNGCQRPSDPCQQLPFAPWPYHPTFLLARSFCCVIEKWKETTNYHSIDLGSLIWGYLGPKRTKIWLLKIWEGPKRILGSGATALISYPWFGTEFHAKNPQKMERKWFAKGFTRPGDPLSNRVSRLGKLWVVVLLSASFTHIFFVWCPIHFKFCRDIFEHLRMIFTKFGNVWSLSIGPCGPIEFKMTVFWLHQLC